VLIGGAHERSGRGERGRGIENPLTGDRVQAEELPLALAQRRALRKCRLRHGEQADVAPLGSQHHVVDLLLQPEPVADGDDPVC
jgi:hypothetical protein